MNKPDAYLMEEYPQTCPKCGNEDIDYNDLAVYGNNAEQKASCAECDYFWVNVYRFVGIAVNP